MNITSDLAQMDDKKTQDMIAFYGGYFAAVELVTCEDCDTDLCIELSGLVGENPGIDLNPVGRAVIPLSAKLLSTRTRLDEAPTGEAMRGYQCLCGNNSLISDVEKQNGVPTGPKPIALDPFSRESIKARIKDINHKPTFKQNGATRHFDSFKVTRVK